MKENLLNMYKKTEVTCLPYNLPGPIGTSKSKLLKKYNQIHLIIDLKELEDFWIKKLATKIP